MERQSSQPEILVFAEDQALTSQARPVVAKQRTEKQNSPCLPRQPAPAGRRVVRTRRANPGKRLLLPASHGDMERDRSLPPPENAPAESGKEDGRSEERCRG